MYSKRKYNHIDDSDISLRPSWLGIIDWKKRCIVNNVTNVNDSTNNNNTNLQEIIQSSNDVEKINDNLNDNSNDNLNDNLNDKIINIDFLYYNERVEFIKKNSVFLKPQYQVVDTIEQYIKLYHNKDKDIAADIPIEIPNEIPIVNAIQNDLNTFQTQKKKKNLNSKYCLASLMLTAGKLNSNMSDMNSNNNNPNNSNNYKKQLSNKKKKNKNNNGNDNYSDSDENIDSTSEPDVDFIFESNRY